jgi:hypothetical protein
VDDCQTPTDWRFANITRFGTAVGTHYRHWANGDVLSGFFHDRQYTLRKFRGNQFSQALCMLVESNFQFRNDRLQIRLRRFDGIGTQPANAIL